jgi:hypothetical protein
VVRRGVRKRIVEATAIPLRGVHKSVEIFLDIDRLEEQAFVTNRLGVFDQNSCGTIDAPHPKSRPKKSAVRIKFFQVRHRMETIDRDSILTSTPVIGFIFDSSSVEQQLPFHAKIKRFFPDLVGSPDADGTFVIHRDLQCLIQPEVSPDDDRTFVPCRKNAAAEAIENAPGARRRPAAVPAEQCLPGPEAPIAGYPGYDSIIGPENATIGEILKENGYVSQPSRAESQPAPVC